MDSYVDVEMADSGDGGHSNEQTRKEITRKERLKANQIKSERLRSISQCADYNDVIIDLDLYNDTYNPTDSANNSNNKISNNNNINHNSNKNNKKDVCLSSPVKSQPKTINKPTRTPSTPMSSLLSTSFSLHDNRSSSHIGPEEFIELVRQKQDFNSSSFCRPGNRRRTVSENQASLNLKFPQSLRLKFISETKQPIKKDLSQQHQHQQKQHQQQIKNDVIYNQPITKDLPIRKSSLDQHILHLPPTQSSSRPYALPPSTLSTNDSMINYPKFNVGSPTSPYSDLLQYGRSPSDHLVLWKGANKRNKIIKLSNAEEESIEEEDEGQLNLESIIESVLRSHSAYDAMEKHARVIILDLDLKVGSAFDAIAYDAIHAAPLWDAQLKLYVGMLTMTDFIVILQQYIDQPDFLSTIRDDPVRKWRDYLLKQRLNEDTNDNNNTMATDTLQEDINNNHNSNSNNNNTNNNNNNNSNNNSINNSNNNNKNTNNNNGGLTISCQSTLEQLSHHLLKHKVHRVLVVNPDTQNPLFLASHRKILNYVWRKLPPLSHTKCTTHIFDKSLYQLSLGTYSGLVSVNINTPVNKVFSILLSQSLSSIPVVNDNLQVVDLFRKADVMSLIIDGNFSDLYRPIKDVLVYARNGFEGLYSCTRSDTAYNVISSMVDLQLHRVVVLDGSGCLEGVVTISDVLNLLLRMDAMDVEDSD